MKSVHIKKMILSALFLAMALVLPFLTGQIPEVGSMLCPMHIPALLCGFFCGWPWGLMVGIVAPLLRSVTFGMPPMFPVAICMAFELATYGAVSGALYQKLPKKKSNIYVALLVAMVLGRIVWGAAPWPPAVPHRWKTSSWEASDTGRRKLRRRQPAQRPCRWQRETWEAYRRSQNAAAVPQSQP